MLSTKYLQEIKERCLQATPPPWHYFPCGEKSNDCLLGVAIDENGSYPPPGKVNLHPYNEDTNEYEMYKYDMETIAAAENNADYADFAFMAHARTDIENLVKEYEFLLEKYNKVVNVKEKSWI